jgi:cell division transport system permease protein
VSVWPRQQLRACRATAAKLLRTPLATLFNVAVLGIALALPALLYVGLVHLQDAARAAAHTPQISVFLEHAAGHAETREIEARLKAHPAIARVRYIPRDQALEDMKRLSGLAGIAESLGHNPLPDAFVVETRDGSPAELQRVSDELRGWPRVAFVQLDSEWAERLAAILRLGRLALFIVGTLLAFALVAVTFNTIRLQILTQREEIEVAGLIGATPRYIRRPFLYYGAVLGLLGGLLAWAVVWAATTALNAALADLSALYGAAWTLNSLSIRDGAALLAFAAALGWLGAWLSVSRHVSGSGGM